MKNNNSRCPVCGAEAETKKLLTSEKFRGEIFENIVNLYCRCNNCKEEFVSDDMMDITLHQIYNQYREKYNILFPEEIKKLRENYGLSPVKMSKLLGFGENIYRNYEAGQVPSLSNAGKLNLAADVEVFEKIIKGKKENIKDILSVSELHSLIEKIDSEKEKLSDDFDLTSPLESILVNPNKPSRYSGYKTLDFKKYTNCVIYYIENINDGFKTYINKFLFYADFIHYKNTGYSITGSEYVALPMGPCPDNYELKYQGMVHMGEIGIEEINGKYDGGNGIIEKFKALESFNKDIFTKSEISALQDSLNIFKRLDKTKEIVDISHNEDGWIENEQNKAKIDYQKYAFRLKN